jgi:hypothetical protein
LKEKSLETGNIPETSKCLDDNNNLRSFTVKPLYFAAKFSSIFILMLSVRKKQGNSEFIVTPELSYFSKRLVSLIFRTIVSFSFLAKSFPDKAVLVFGTNGHLGNSNLMDKSVCLFLDKSLVQ